MRLPDSAAGGFANSQIHLRLNNAARDLSNLVARDCHLPDLYHVKAPIYDARARPAPGVREVYLPTLPPHEYFAWAGLNAPDLLRS